MKPNRTRTAADRVALAAIPLAPGTVVLLMVSALTLQSCKPAGNQSIDERPPARPEAVTTDTMAIDLSFDPLGAEGDALVVPEALRDSVALRLSPTTLTSTTPASTLLDSTTGPADSNLSGLSAETVRDTAAYDTYRVQVFNSRVFTEAALERAVATEIFDYNVTLDYEVPYFKVRLGDFPDAKVAENYLREYVKPAGYPDSWVARVRVTPQKSAEAQAQLTAYFDSLRTAILLEGLDLDALDSLGALDSLPDDSKTDASSSNTPASDSGKSKTEGGDE